MILNKIELSNFRSFYGHHEFIFANNSNNVTVLVTEDGKVKEKDFLRAIQFVLFGKSKKTDSEESQRAINLIALNENKGNPTKGSVTIYFESAGKTYIIKRVFIASRRDKIEENVVTNRIVYSSKLEENARMELKTNEEEINQIVSSLFKQYTLDLFYIDERKIEQLTHNNERIIENIKKEISQFFQKEDLKEVIQILEELSKEGYQKLKETANKIGQLDTLQMIEEKILEKKRKLEKIKQIQKEHEQENFQIKTLASNSTSKTQDSKSIKQVRDLQVELLASYKNRLNDIHIIDGVDLLLSDYYIDAQNYLSQLTFENDLLSGKAVLKTLEEEKCVLCGNELTNNNSSRHNVHLMGNYLENRDVNEEIQKIEKQIVQGQKNSSQIQEVLSDLFKKVEHLKIKIKEERENNPISSIIQQEEKIENETRGMKILQKEIEQLKKNIQWLTREFEESLKEDSEALMNFQILKFADQLKTKLEKNNESSQQQLKEKLISEAITIFEKTFYLSDNNQLGSLEITNDYRISLGNSQSVHFQELDIDIQKKIIFSFLLALIKIYPNYIEALSYPLFTSNILSTFEDELSEIFIQKISEFSYQWVLFLTDVEYQKYIDILEKTNRVANYQKL